MDDSFNEDEQTIHGPGWLELQRSVEKLRKDLTTLCDSLEVIVNLENTKLVATGRVEIPDTSRMILGKEQQFIEKFREKVKGYEKVELEGGDNSPEYVILYQTLTKELHKSIHTLIVSLKTKLDFKTKAAKSVIAENKKLILQQQEKERELTKEQKRSETAMTEKNTLKARCNKLEEQLAEKNKKIQQLLTESTVVLWNREKKRLLGSIHSNENKLEKQLQFVSGDADETRHRLQQRIEDLQSKLQMLKIRNSTKTVMTREETSTLQRNLFLKERLFVVAESELKKQQVYYLGLLKGLRKDYQITKAANNMSENNGNGHLREREFVTRMDKVVDALGKGDIVKLRSSLPSHYLGYDLKLQGFPIKQPQNKKTKFIIKNSQQNIDLDNTDIGKSLVKWRLGDEEDMPSLGKLLREIQREHPSFVDDEGRLQVNEARAYFPAVAEDKIVNYFSLFKTWDDNGDLSLDTSEILHNLPGMLGYMSTTEEVADAIREIDIDESGTIDFYEFLLLTKMLEEGEGKSKFFQKNDFLKLNSQLEGTSKTCSIQ